METSDWLAIVFMVFMLGISIGIAIGVYRNAKVYEGDIRTHETNEGALYNRINDLRIKNERLECELKENVDTKEALKKELESVRRRHLEVQAQNEDILQSVNSVRDRVEMLFRNKENEHQNDLECADCYWRTQMKRDRDDYMNTIAAKEAIIKNLQATIKELKEKNPIGFNK